VFPLRPIEVGWNGVLGFDHCAQSMGMYNVRLARSAADLFAFTCARENVILDPVFHFG